MAEDALALPSTITELEKGFSAVQLEGDDGFEGFLAGGGASSDGQVVEFLSSHLLADFNILGGIFGCSTIAAGSRSGDRLLLMGIRLFLKKGETALPKTKAISGVKIFLSSFAIGITSPAAILTFLFAFSYFGISGATGPRGGIGLVCGVFIGTYLWWDTLTAATRAIRRKTGSRGFRYMNQVFGTVLILFASSVFVKTIG